MVKIMVEHPIFSWMILGENPPFKETPKYFWNVHLQPGKNDPIWLHFFFKWVGSKTN